MRNKKIILDTNLWISFLISKKFSQLDKLIENNTLTLIFSDELIEEFVDVVSHLNLKNTFQKRILRKFLKFLTNLEN